MWWKKKNDENERYTQENKGNLNWMKKNKKKKKEMKKVIGKKSKKKTKKTTKNRWRVFKKNEINYELGDL